MRVYGRVEKFYNSYTQQIEYETYFYTDRRSREMDLELDEVPFSFELDLDPASLFPEELTVAASPVAIDKTDRECTYPDCSFNGCCGSTPK